MTFFSWDTFLRKKNLPDCVFPGTAASLTVLTQMTVVARPALAGPRHPVTCAVVPAAAVQQAAGAEAPRGAL